METRALKHYDEQTEAYQDYFANFFCLVLGQCTETLEDKSDHIKIFLMQTRMVYIYCRLSRHLLICLKINAMLVMPFVKLAKTFKNYGKGNTNLYRITMNGLRVMLL